MSSLSVAPSAKFGASNSTLKFLGIKKVLHAEEELWGENHQPWTLITPAYKRDALSASSLFAPAHHSYWKIRNKRVYNPTFLRKCGNNSDTLVFTHFVISHVCRSLSSPGRRTQVRCRHFPFSIHLLNGLSLSPFYWCRAAWRTTRTHRQRPWRKIQNHPHTAARHTHCRGGQYSRPCWLITEWCDLSKVTPSWTLWWCWDSYRFCTHVEL